MKKFNPIVFFSTLIFSIMSLQLFAAETIDYQQKFEKIKIDCTTGKIINTRSRLSCYQLEMLKEMRATPENRELILQAALMVNPASSRETVKVAIDAGMAPLVTLMRAIETLPLQHEEIGNGAIDAGIDPFVVTETISSIQN